MAAPMFSNSTSSKKTLKSVILSNVLVFLILLGITFVPFNRTSNLDVVSNSLTAVKVLTGSVLVLHILAHAVLHKTEQKYKLHNVIKEIARSIGLFIGSTIFIHCLAVLFGAPFFDKTAETFHFAMLLSSAAVAPILIHFGTSSETWLRVFIFQSGEPGIETVVYASSLCSVIGAWIGAFPIPLDWDRAWQVWPTTCVLGTVLGHCAGILISTVHLCQLYYRANKHKLT